MHQVSASRLREGDKIQVESTGLICVIELLTYNDQHDFVYVQYDDKGRKCSVSFRVDEFVTVLDDDS